MLKELSKDETVPKFATHLVYLTSSESKERIEWKTFYSIFRKQPKRADLYWFIHVTTLDEPHTMEYKAEVLEDDDIVWIEFRLGFRVQPRINLFFRKAVEDLVKRNEVILTSRYPSLQKYDQPGDFRFVVIERYLSYGVEFPLFQKFILESYFLIKKFTLTEGKSFGLDTSSVTVEKIPLTIPNTNEIRMTRVFDDQDLIHRIS
jgi:KUP system potassium uptake protein